jgi:hypothetical protein
MKGRVSDPDRRFERPIPKATALPEHTYKCPPIAEFGDSMNGLRGPIWVTSGSELLIVCGGYLKYSHFFGECRWRPGSICTAWPVISIL